MTDQRMDDNEPSEEVYGVMGLEISVNAVLADLARLDQLRIKHEQNKRDLVGGDDPISDDSFLEWMHATHGNRVDLEEHPQLQPWNDTKIELAEAEKLLRERLGPCRCWCTNAACFYCVGISRAVNQLER